METESALKNRNKIRKTRSNLRLSYVRSYKQIFDQYILHLFLFLYQINKWKKAKAFHSSLAVLYGTRYLLYTQCMPYIQRFERLLFSLDQILLFFIWWAMCFDWLKESLNLIGSLYYVMESLVKCKARKREGPSFSSRYVFVRKKCPASQSAALESLHARHLYCVSLFTVLGCVCVCVCVTLGDGKKETDSLWCGRERNLFFLLPSQVLETSEYMLPALYSRCPATNLIGNFCLGDYFIGWANV